MRISELAERSGTSPATIKFYVREGLLPPAAKTGYNQVSYGEEHVRRLHLVRALVDVGGLPISRVRAVVAAVDDPQVPLTEVMGVAQHALPGREASSPPSDPSRAAVLDLVAAQGWAVHDGNPGLAQVAAVLDTWVAMGRKDLFDGLPHYARAAEAVARTDLALVWPDAADRDRSAETVVVGTVLGDVLVAGLRRIAQEHVARTTSHSHSHSTEEPS
ncbi:MerR HTH family regulatory protein [Quadrisphaera granulorum]|uniref:MerR-like DNA binding protein n=1 Tax=Quadrisphaera granulorum TaxID=317664 RepID=A0A316AH05_9ACTN|nr:MerR family transcriptional regulator [Quadrisphaera granulorum]PWJ56164.1 MerR-like DNA binding protein [Quadrisphaera granulorum]SZE94798.1 MerR HTH family regulatory protein [Quadrisphaera granulorum]